MTGACALGILWLTTAIAAVMATVTHSGLLGICGPYGDRRWVAVQAVLILSGLVGAAMVVVVRRRTR